ncbi:hypothetical protein BC834DRAFT_179762 [Gloeopeniophorella convolvens]|nr:hypothetical protein BC834DRAFT_179762 [Gloeopeniophorella convolvens]
MHQNAQNTIDALEAYIQSQKALLARTQADIDRLRRLREQAATDSEDFFGSLDEKLNDSALRLDERHAIATEVQDKINWSLFKGQDPTPLRTFATDLRAAQYARSQPSATQQTALSEVQQLVRDARRTMIEPVLASFELSSDSSDDEDPVPEEVQRAREREQLRRMRLRQGGLTLRASGVVIRRDLEDESADVDIAAEPLPSTPSSVSMITSLPSPRPAGPSSTSSCTRSPRLSRARRPHPVRPQPVRTKQPALKSKQLPPGSDSRPSAPSSAKKEKPKSETYKQAWSVSEQHLLERLLVEIPDGEKNRWSKISKAMGGRRTPRQVASRVQKYFEKLKLFGVNVEQASVP